MEGKVVNKTRNEATAHKMHSITILYSNISFIQHISVPKYLTKNSAFQPKKWPTNTDWSYFYEQAPISLK